MQLSPAVDLKCANATKKHITPQVLVHVTPQVFCCNPPGRKESSADVFRSPKETSDDAAGGHKLW